MEQLAVQVRQIPWRSVIMVDVFSFASPTTPAQQKESE